jgi:hypothetical protein
MECTNLVNQFKSNLIQLYGAQEYLVTPYLHILIGHLPELQLKLGFIIGFYQNSGLFRLL